jgi:hypothetical protein
MARSPSRYRTTRLGLVLSALSLAALLGACASRGPSPGTPPPGPGPIGAPPGGEPGFPGGTSGGRYPRYTEPIKQISRRAGHLGWGGVEVGMTFRQAELAIGRHLPALGSTSEDVLCGYYSLETGVLGQPLRLEFEAKGGESRLKAIWLPLVNRAGALSTPEMARALKARFPDLRYEPGPYTPDLAEAENPRPLYRLDKGGMFFVDPHQGIYFGEICID